MSSELKKISMSLIRTNNVALRDADQESEGFIQLVGSVKKDGVLNTILVRRKAGDDGKQFELVDGLQRFSAAQVAGTGVVGEPGMINVNIVDKDEADSLLTQIIANTHKIETKPVEYARGIMRILAYFPTKTMVELAGELNKSPAWLSKQLGLIKLNETIKKLVDEGKITLSNAYPLAKLPPDEQLKFMDRAQTEDSAVFGEACLTRTKEIREANRAGRDPGEEQFQPASHLRKKVEIEEERANPTILPQIAESNNLLADVKPNHTGLKQALALGIKLGLEWATHTDPESVKIQRQKWDERKQHEAAEKARRAQEKQAKKAEESKKAEEDARALGEAARAAAPEGEPLPV